MGITRFQFVERVRNASIEEISFSNFNLLVGLSGVGKSRILNSLEAVQQAGISNARSVNGCEWTIELVYEGTKYLWSAKTSHVMAQPRPIFSGLDEQNERHEGEIPRFLSERIIRDDKIILVDRTLEKFEFNNLMLPLLKPTESAITLLGTTPILASLYHALRQMIFSRDFTVGGLSLPDPSLLNTLCERYQSLSSLREAADLPTLLKAYVLQEIWPEEFDIIKREYSAIFDTVTDIKIDELDRLDPLAIENRPPVSKHFLMIGIKERGINGWITVQFSSGMFRTLMLLIELFLAPSGTVIAIDEIENSLGVNCLDEVVDRMLRRLHDLQFILTSHHPYVINNVPSKHWKLVTRQGSTITVLDEHTIPALQTASKHEKFLLLMNLPEYEEGIQ